MKQILLTNGLCTLVDDADFDYLSQWTWAALHNAQHTPPHQWYAVRYETIDGKQHSILMHRVIMNASAGTEVDHRDSNGLDNQRSNLRIATRSQNACNRSMHRNNKSGYKGVYAERHSNTFRAQIKVNGVRHSLGNYPNVLDAARAYNEAALRLHGEFASLNQVD